MRSFWRTRSIAELPIGTCELQGYAYDALRLGDIYETLGRLDDAERLHAEARHEHFNNDFWWESEGTYYLGLDGQKHPIESVASNAGRTSPAASSRRIAPAASSNG